MRMADFCYNQFSTRRSYEWKVTLGFWAVILSSIIISEVQPPPLWVAVLIYLLYIFGWLRSTWVANDNDKKRVYRGIEVKK